MIKTRLDVRTPDGTAEAHFYRPDGSGPFPGVLFFIDALLVRPSMHQMSERLASNGFAVLLPNVFYRAGQIAPFDTKNVWGNEGERNRLMALIHALDAASAMRDTAAYLDTLAQQPGVKPGPLGAVGYCLGGRLAFTAAGAMPDRLGAVACIHGGQIATDAPESPHRQASKINAKLYFGIADNDRSCTPEQVKMLEGALDAAGVKYQAELYPGAAHGFAVPDSHAYNEAAAERHWERVVALFKAAL